MQWGFSQQNLVLAELVIVELDFSVERWYLPLIIATLHGFEAWSKEVECEVLAKTFLGYWSERNTLEVIEEFISNSSL